MKPWHVLRGMAAQAGHSIGVCYIIEQAEPGSVCEHCYTYFSLLHTEVGEG
jgi:hypothetical protein